MWKKRPEKIITGCATDRGTVRDKNQDRIVCLSGHIVQGTAAVGCVCDGIGSFAYSEIASEMVTEGVRLWFQSAADGRLGNLTEEELTEDLCATIRELNELVWDRGERERLDLGCTMSALLLIGRSYHIFHAGDSRICLAGDLLRQLTRDEIVYTRERGNIRRKLANCIGRSRELRLSRLSGTAEPGDTFLLGSDGLFHRAEEEELCQKARRVTSDAQALKFCGEMIKRVEQLGERDNVSCGMIKLRA